MEINRYKLFYGFEKEPFRSDIDANEILQTPQLTAAGDRFEYAAALGAVYLITGEIGSGKSTTLRYLLNGLHPSEYRVIYVTATTGSILELYRLIRGEMGMRLSGMSRAVMSTQIRREVLDLVNGKKMNAVLVVDEASLLRLEVFTELHTLCQFEMDSKPYLPLVLAGQSNLVDKLMYPASMPLASRIVARSHFVGSDRDQMKAYLLHHLSIVGIKKTLFDETAVTAIHQGSGGIYRKANHLARGALIAAAMEKQKIVNAEHVRIAASEIF
jgi:general secretion pathway protein A